VAATRRRACTQHSGVGDRDGSHLAEVERIRVLLSAPDGILDGFGADLATKFVAPPGAE
jgi:hypothetical protein